MPVERERRTPYQSRGYRLVSGTLGVVLTGAGVYVLFFLGSIDVVQLLAGAALVLLGADLSYCASTGKASWLSRIGPLP
mgnify:FL=1